MKIESNVAALTIEEMQNVNGGFCLAAHGIGYWFKWGFGIGLGVGGAYAVAEMA